MFDVAKSNKVVLFEAFTTPYNPNFKVLKENLKSLGKIRSASFSYCQYSSRYLKFLNGENPKNVLSLDSLKNPESIEWFINFRKKELNII